MISAFDWTAFGFKVYQDQPDTFVYNNTVNEENFTPPDFLKSVWSHIDEDGDGTLQKCELSVALSDMFAHQKLSKMVCYHQSEWGVDFGSLKSEIEVLLDEGIDKEENSDEKQRLTDEKVTILSNVEQKVNTFNFWGDVEVMEFSFKEPGSYDRVYYHLPQNFKLKKEILPYESVFPGLSEIKLAGVKLPRIPELDFKTRTLPAQPKFYHFHPIAFVQQMKRMDPVSTIIFPFEIKPQNAKDNSTYNGKEWYATAETNSTTFGSRRDNGARKHAGRDLYATWGTPVRAMADGVVVEKVVSWYCNTGVISINHELSDGRRFICRYGEVDGSTIAFKKGDNVKQGDLIARVGFLKYSSNNYMPPKQQPRKIRTNMLHFEFYSNGETNEDIGVNLESNIYKRKRSDLSDPLAILQEAYDNSFVKNPPEDPDRFNIQSLHVSNAGIEFIKVFEGTHKSGVMHTKYDDSNDPKKAKATIGYGHLIANTNIEDTVYSSDLELKNGISKVEFENGIDEDRATDLLRQDLITAENGVKKHIKVALTQNEFDALVSLSFNAGADCLGVKGAGGGDTNVKKLINRGDYYNGIDEIADIVGGDNHGLVKRRQAEITVFKSNYYAIKIP